MGYASVTNHSAMTGQKVGMSPQTTRSYLLTSDGEEYGNCYDPTKNDGKYYTDACFENVDIDDAHGHLKHGKFCVCDGEKDDLCNEDYFKHRPDNGVTSLTHSLLCSLLFSMVLLMINHVL